MKPRSLLVLTVSLLLALTAAAWLQRTTGAWSGGRVELGRTRLLQVSDELSRLLESLTEPVFFTYYVSAREKLPSHAKQLEGEVAGLLETLRRENPDQVDYRIVDPDDSPELTRYASRRRVAPIRMRQVSRDAYSETEVWSTLTLELGARKPTRLDAVGPEHLPRLQDLLTAQLEQLLAPRDAVFALDAGPGHDRLAELLDERGDVQRIQLGRGDALADDVDVLVWMNAPGADAALLARLERFLDRGGRAIIGLAPRASWREDDGTASLLLHDDLNALEGLLVPLGIRPQSGLVFDQTPAPVKVSGRDTHLPFLITCSPIDQDFHSLAREMQGALVFPMPVPIALDGDALAAAGLHADVLATSSAKSSLVPLEPGTWPVERLVNMYGDEVPKQPLVTWLRRADPLAGSVILLSSGGPFGDQLLGGPARSSRNLLDALLDTLASDQALVVARSGLDRPEPLPALSAGSRLGWRIACVVLLPAIVMVLTWLHLRRGRSTGAPRRRWEPALAGRLLGGLVLACLVAGLLAGPRLRADLTDADLNRLAPRTRELAWSCRGDGALEAELLVSPPALLPPELRRGWRSVRGTLAELDAAGADLTVVTRRPEELTDAEREALAEDGLKPLHVSSREEEQTHVRKTWSVLRLHAFGRTESLVFPDEASFDDLEFKLAFALWRLKEDRRPHVAFASDLPRLSPAEAYHYYQEKGLIAPSGKDVFSISRRRLEELGFRVTHVDPKKAQLPRSYDLLCWLQPRRNVHPLLEPAVESLYRGGNVLIAAQHFSVQSRQYAGTDYEFVYWPQPQWPDLEHHYLPDLGIEMVRELLFDRQSFRLELESQVHRTQRREFTTMDLAEPFYLRAVAENFDTDSVVTRHLGDQAFPNAAWFRLDQERLDELGLTARTLMTTSEDAWTFKWEGGWIPREVLEGPSETTRVGAVPLAVLVEGQFPWPTQGFERPRPETPPDGGEPVMVTPPYPRSEPADGAAPGRLLLLSCSELFKDERLPSLAPRFRGDHLLLNAVASLTLDEGLAEVLSRRSAGRGFESVDDGARLRWRLAALLSLPVLLIGLAVLRRLGLARPIPELR
ncbi:MAG: Gldg family protein [Acidobacteriota bacterium]